MATTSEGGGAQHVEALRERVRALEAEVQRLQGSLDAREESERRYRSLIDNAPVSVLVISKGIIRYANLALERLTGDLQDPQETSIVGRPMSDLIHPDSKQSVAARMKRAFSSGVAAEPVHQKFLRSNGEVIDAIAVGAPCTFEGDAAIQVVFVDITPQKRAESDLKRAEESLRRSEAFFRAIIEQSGEGTAIVRPDGRFSLVNRALCEMTGHGEEELTRRSMRDLLPEGTPFELFSGVVEGEQRVSECEMIRKDGSGFPAEVSAYPLLVGDQQLALGIVRDLTERRRVEQERLELESQIQQAQKLESIGLLAGGIAHDFNNLLVGVLGNADLALHDLAPEAPARGSVNNIVVAAERAAELVRQMLAYAGRGRFVVEPLDLGSIVEEMTHLLEVSISKKATLRVHLARQLPLIEADVTQVRQVVMNLITNASDALADHSGVITVVTGTMECDLDYLRETYLDDSLAAGPYAYLEVIDTGAGMDEETLQRVFDPFFTTKFAGRGLGLAAVLGIVRGHCGAIKIYSEPGQGSTFKILFPTAVMANDARELSSTDAAAQTFSGHTILLVDDDETVRLVGGRMLRRLGCKVVTACHGLEAVEAFRRQPDRFAAILLDLTMPQMDGEVCFRELRRIRPDVRVILSSGYNEQELITRFAGKGLAGFVQKPYRMTTLSQKLREALGPPDG